MFKRIRNTIDIANSLVASNATGWQGMMVRENRSNETPDLTLFDIEGDPHCRLVREALTELHLDCNILPCPQGGNRFKKKLQAASSDVAAPPILQDKTAKMVLTGLDDCIGHLFSKYGGAEIPVTFSNRAMLLRRAGSHVATMIRRDRGLRMRPSKAAKKPMELWSFEASPFSRRVRERLCEMQIPYLLHNLGKEQIGDLGMHRLRIQNLQNRLKKYAPTPGGKRAEFLEKKGMVQVPYLFDPNTGQGLFESSAILDYLNKHYG